MVEQVVTDRLLVDVDADGRVSVSTWLDGELPGGPVGEPTELVWPLDGDALEDLRWYLEDYLRAPFGVYEDRGSRVEARQARPNDVATRHSRRLRPSPQPFPLPLASWLQGRSRI